jgi:GTP cyclohydrolase I
VLDLIGEDPSRDGLVVLLVKNIEFFSLCEHHMLPFHGRMHLAYLPSRRVIGLSKIPRIVNMFARRLQVQERLTREVAEAICRAIAPRGVAVMCEASHFCIMMRGIEKQFASTGDERHAGRVSKE